MITGIKVIRAATPVFLILSGVTLMAWQPARSVRGEVRASHGVVAAGRTFTVDAGARLMGAGGNAIDGGVASIFAASVVEISHFGLGGEAPIIIYSARDKRVIVVNGQGIGAQGGESAALRREGRDPRQRAARRDAAGGGGLGVDRAGEVRHEVAVGGPAAGDRAGRRLPDVRVPAPLPRERAQRLRAVRVDDEDLLSRRNDHARRRDVPSAQSGGDLARAGGRREGRAGARRVAQGRDRSRARRVL